jgi:hypothetical protein
VPVNNTNPPLAPWFISSAFVLGTGAWIYVIWQWFH